MKKNLAKRDPIKNYFPLPNEIYQLGLSPGAIAVYGYLLRIEDRTTYQCYPSYGTIGQWSMWNLIHDLLVLIGKSTNVQAVFGQGHTTGGSSASDLLTTGTLSDKGQFYGTSDTVSAMKVFHIENFWGDRWDRVVGCINDHGVYKIKMTPEGSGYNLTGAGYPAVASVVHRPGTDAAFGGWVNAAQQTEYGQFPTGISGGDTTYDCDFHYVNDDIVAVAVVGGGCAYGAGCGRSVAVDNVAGAAGWFLSPALSLQYN